MKTMLSKDGKTITIKEEAENCGTREQTFVAFIIVQNWIVFKDGSVCWYRYSGVTDKVRIGAKAAIPVLGSTNYQVEVLREQGYALKHEFREEEKKMMKVTPTELRDRLDWIDSLFPELGTDDDLNGGDAVDRLNHVREALEMALANPEDETWLYKAHLLADDEEV